ncbi:MAG TPA: HAMP domain-containing sensor histidine kinase [Flavisolibacter sp.]|jgi:signal transduction histidine kinase|nr:HAMP domain-containing sensor histidine kinase [Flavisolibacter sp.]
MTVTLSRKLPFLGRLKSIGFSAQLDDYEKRKLGVFNQLNFLGILSGIGVTIAGMMDNQELPPIASVVAFSPAVISLIVLLLNHYQQYERARMVYFSLYPLLTASVYGAGLDVGIELFFVLYALLAVFYMQKPVNAIIAFVVAAGCYLMVFTFGFSYHYHLKEALFPFYVFNHVMAFVFIFFALFWIKKENTGYQFSILQKNRALHKTNLEIEAQKIEIARKAEELAELDTLKNKLFSIIAHDLKGPMYAQRNLFRSIEQYNIPGEEIKLLVPDILNDMNYTINLMDNLLHWAKCQMQSDVMKPQKVDLAELTESVTRLLRLQAEAKEVQIQCRLEQPTYVYADKEMINLVLRNLLSNAIKFTPRQGSVVVEALNRERQVEICVTDSGVGMTPEAISKLSENNYYTTKGTANESGTGLGLMLCKEFLQKNGSSMRIESKQGQGSKFAFALPSVN